MSLERLPLSYLLFADDCLLIDQTLPPNIRSFVTIVEVYCRVSGQLVNLQKSTITFSPRTQPWVKQMIRERLGILKQAGPPTYLGVSIMGQRLQRAKCRLLE